VCTAMGYDELTCNEVRMSLNDLELDDNTCDVGWVLGWLFSRLSSVFRNCTWRSLNGVLLTCKG
jgi:hypothetical protein